MSESANEIDLYPIPGPPSLEEQVTWRLRRMIINGSIPQGTKLVQRRLAKQLNVSPTPVRWAWVQLASERLMTIDERGHGRVTHLTWEDFQEIFAARLGLEGLAARLGAEAAVPSVLEAMQQIFAELRRHAMSKDRVGYLQARWRFHATAYEAAGRSRLLEEVERLYWRAERYNHVLLADDQRFDESLAHYKRFLDACEQRDGAAGEAAVVRSIHWGVKILEGSLPSEVEIDGDEA